jgi:hypothetical protein
LETIGEAQVSYNIHSFDFCGDCRTLNLSSPRSCLHVYMAMIVITFSILSP